MLFSILDGWARFHEGKPCRIFRRTRKRGHIPPIRSRHPYWYRTRLSPLGSPNLGLVTNTRSSSTPPRVRVCTTHTFSYREKKGGLLVIYGGHGCPYRVVFCFTHSRSHRGCVNFWVTIRSHIVLLIGQSQTEGMKEFCPIRPHYHWSEFSFFPSVGRSSSFLSPPWFNY